MAATPKPKLSVKEINFIKGIVAGKSRQQAAHAATDTSSIESAAANAKRMLNKPSVQEALEAALEKHGINLDTVIKPVGDALKDDELETRLKGHDRAVKLMGLATTHIETGNTYNFTQVNAEMKDKYE